MREIKFRAWRSGDGGCMEFGHYVPDHGNINWFDLSNSVGKDLILMQYTGLKDRNGKEIYEGDVLSPPISLEVSWKLGEVRWAYGAFRVHGFTLIEVSVESFILGNIYENKELNYDPLSDR
jgi:hypothetical protein